MITLYISRYACAIFVRARRDTMCVRVQLFEVCVRVHLYKHLCQYCVLKKKIQGKFPMRLDLNPPNSNKIRAIRQNFVGIFLYA